MEIHHHIDDSSKSYLICAITCKSGKDLKFRSSFVYTVSPGKSFDKVTVLDKLSLAGTTSDLVTFILNWLKQDEDEAEDEEDIKDLYGLN